MIWPLWRQVTLVALWPKTYYGLKLIHMNDSYGHAL